MSAVEPVWSGVGYSPSGNCWGCPEPGCGHLVAGLDYFDPEDPDPVGEHLAIHARADGRRLAVDMSGRVWLTDDEGAAVFDVPVEDLRAPSQLPPQHAKPSRRSSIMLGRALFALLLVVLAVLVACLVIVLTGGPASADPGVPHRWLAVHAAGWVLFVPGGIVLASAAGVGALAAFERWYERRGGGAR